MTRRTRSEPRDKSPDSADVCAQSTRGMKLIAIKSEGGIWWNDVNLCAGGCCSGSSPFTSRASRRGVEKLKIYLQSRRRCYEGGKVPFRTFISFQSTSPRLLIIFLLIGHNFVISRMIISFISSVCLCVECRHSACRAVSFSNASQFHVKISWKIVKISSIA